LMTGRSTDCHHICALAIKSLMSAVQLSVPAMTWPNCNANWPVKIRPHWPLPLLPQPNPKESRYRAENNLPLQRPRKPTTSLPRRKLPVLPLFNHKPAQRRGASVILPKAFKPLQLRVLDVKKLPVTPTYKPVPETSPPQTW